MSAAVARPFAHEVFLLEGENARDGIGFPQARAAKEPL